MPLQDAYRLRLPYLMVTLLAWGACAAVMKISADNAYSVWAVLGTGITNIVAGGLAISAIYSPSVFSFIVHPSSSPEHLGPTLFIMGFQSLSFGFFMFAYV